MSRSLKKLDTLDVVGEARRCGAVFDLDGERHTFECHEDLEKFFAVAYRIGISVAHGRNESLLKEMLKEERYSDNERNLMKLLHDYSAICSYPPGIFRMRSKEDDDQSA